MKHFPSHYQMFSSGLNAFAGCCTSAVLFWTDFIPSNVFVLGVMWALFVTSLDVTISIRFAIRSVIGSAVGSGMGLACAFLSEAISGDVNYHISTAFAFVFAVILAFADESVNSPLTPFIKADLAAVSLYLVASFSREVPLLIAWYITVSVAIGSGIGIGSVLLFRMMTSQWGCKQQMDRALMGFSKNLAKVFEGLVSYITSGPDHYPEMERRLAKLDAEQERVYMKSKLMEMSSWRSIPADLHDDLISCLSVIPLQLIALQHTLDRGYSDDLCRKVWVPVEPHLDLLVSAVVKTLRPSGEPADPEHIGMLSNNLYIQLIEAIVSLGHVTGHQSEDLQRFVFAFLAVMRLARLLNRFSRLRTLFVRTPAPLTLTPSFKRFGLSFRHLVSFTDWEKCFKPHLRFVLKLAVSQQILGQALVAWHDASPTGIPYNASWAMLALIFCSLRTVGGSIVKGFRRLAGTTIGGGLALLSIQFTTSGDAYAFMVQLSLVSFFGKLFSYIPVIGYASTVVPLSWVVVALANWSQPLTPSEQFTFALNRIILTAIGAFAAVIFGIFILPTFAADLYRAAEASTIHHCTQFVNRAVELVVSERSVFDPELAVNSHDLVAAYLFTAADEINKKMRKDEILRRTIAEESEVEIMALNILCLFQRQSKSAVPFSKLIQLRPTLRSLSYEAMCTFATAAGTLVREDVMHVTSETTSQALRNLLADLNRESLRVERVLRHSGKQDAQPLNPGEFSRKELLYLGQELTLAVTDQDRYKSALEGGLLRVFAFLFTLERFRVAWNDMISKVQVTTI